MVTRRKLRIALLAVALLVPRFAEAALLPSFSEEWSAWNATHIVVATEGAKVDGALEVIESWRGDLRAGDRLNVPDLAAFEDESTREISPGLWSMDEGKTPKRHVTGARMILFLAKTEDGWKPAAGRGEMKISVAWVEEGKAYAFVQEMNPGPQELIEVGVESEMKSRTTRSNGEKDALAKASALDDPGERARALAPLTRSDLRAAQLDAFAALGKCGPAALEVLRGLLRRDGKLNRDALAAIVAAAGEQAGPDLTALLDDALAFWREKGPTLPSLEWWNGADAEPLRARYSELYDLLNALAGARWSGCERSVGDLRDLWRSLPQLNGVGGGQIADTCDAVLRALKEPRPTPAARPSRRDDDEESTRAPSLDEIPLTSADDERRLAELEAKLAAELEAERKLVLGRAPLRDAATDDDVVVALNRALDLCTPPGYEDWSGLFKTLEGWKSFAPPPSSDALDAFRKKMSPNLAAIAPILTASRVGAACEIESTWEHTLVCDPPSNMKTEGPRAALALACIRALRDDPARAARLALDLWRFEHDLARDERTWDVRKWWNWRPIAARLALEAIAKLDGDALAAIEKELARLEDGLPPFERTVRRKRLAYEHVFRAARRREALPYETDPLQHLSAQARLADRRLGSLRREWDRFEELARGIEDAATKPVHEGRAAIAEHQQPPPRWRHQKKVIDRFADEITREHESFVLDVARLRAVRALVANRLGHDLSLADPFTGEALKVALVDGAPAVTIAASRGRDEKDVTLALPKR